jgi:hypothetical protein
MTDVNLQPWLTIWLIAAAYLMLRYWRRNSGAGLIFTYVLTFGVMHWMAAALYMLPWHYDARVDLTALGLRESAIGMVALVVGSEVATLFVAHRMVHWAPLPEAPRAVDSRLTRLYLICGAALYVGLFPLAGRLPSVEAILSSGSTIAVVAISLICWNAWALGRPGRLWGTLAASCLLPVVTVIGQGFLGYGFAAMLTILAFVASFYRPRWRVVAAACVLTYLGMSVYVTYMRDRKDIRNVVWGGAALSERFARLGTTLSTAEWFDIYNTDHLDRIDSRLNQDVLIGAAVQYLAGGSVPFAKGETIVDAALAVIPRALWPDKPTIGGSGDLVSTYTGIRFAEGTSVGVGQVLEAYINFGTDGVVVVFFVIGGVLALMDRMAYRRLVSGDGSGFLLWYLPGLAILQVGGSFAEMTATAGANLLVALVLQRVAARFVFNRRGPVRTPDTLAADVEAAR